MVNDGEYGLWCLEGNTQQQRRIEYHDGRLCTILNIQDIWQQYDKEQRNKQKS